MKSQLDRFTSHPGGSDGFGGIWNDLSSWLSLGRCLQRDAVKALSVKAVTPLQYSLRKSALKEPTLLFNGAHVHICHVYLFTCTSVAWPNLLYPRVSQACSETWNDFAPQSWAVTPVRPDSAGSQLISSSDGPLFRQNVYTRMNRILYNVRIKKCLLELIICGILRLIMINYSNFPSSTYALQKQWFSNIL